MASKTYVTIDVQEEYMAAHLFGELDHHSVQPIREEIDSMAGQNKPTELILDFGGVTFMDSSGIGLVMGRYKLMQELGGTLRLTQLSASIRRVMQVAGMDKLAKF